MTSYSAGCDGKLRMWNVSQPATTASIIGIILSAASAFIL